jgi:hypothetical protein
MVSAAFARLIRNVLQDPVLRAEFAGNVPPCFNVLLQEEHPLVTRPQESVHVQSLNVNSNPKVV